MKKIFFSCVMIGLSAILIACSFEPRSAKLFPTALRTVYFSSSKPYSPLSTGLHALFKNMHATLVKNQDQAHFSVMVTGDSFTYSRPETVNSSLPSQLNYSQTAKVSIVDNQTSKALLHKNFKTADSLTLNANQIYTDNANALIQAELNRRLVSLIYYWLTSQDVKKALTHEHKTHSSYQR